MVDPRRHVPDQLEWVVNGYTLSFAALLVTGAASETSSAGG